MEWPHVSSYVELLHSVTDMGTNIPMSLSLKSNFCISVFIFCTEICLFWASCLRASEIDWFGLNGRGSVEIAWTTTATDQSLRLLLWTKGLGLTGLPLC